MDRTSDSRNTCGDGRLAAFHRTVRLPTGLWNAVKARGQQDGKAVRWIIDDALDAELMSLIDALRDLGFDGTEEADKLVRAPLDDNVIARLNYGRRRTGLPAVQLLRLCLRRHVAR